MVIRNNMRFVLISNNLKYDWFTVEKYKQRNYKKKPQILANTHLPLQNIRQLERINE